MSIFRKPRTWICFAIFIVVVDLIDRFAYYPLRTWLLVVDLLLLLVALGFLSPPWRRHDAGGQRR